MTNLDVEDLDSAFAFLDPETALRVRGTTAWRGAATSGGCTTRRRNKRTLAYTHDVCNTQSVQHVHVRRMVKVAEVQEGQNTAREATVKARVVEPAVVVHDKRRASGTGRCAGARATGRWRRT